LNILGIWDGHDAGAALLVDGRVAVAINEERLTRRKLEIHFPVRSIAACLECAGLAPRQIDVVAASTTDPAKTLGRWVPSTKERYYRVRRRKAEPGPLSWLSRAVKYRMTEWPPNALSRAASRQAIRRELARLDLRHARLDLHDHHACHAVAAARASGFRRCAVVTIDGLGDGLSASVSAYDAGRLTTLVTSPASQSIGVFFEHVTTLLNMRELEDEGKVMALADYAAPIPDDRNPLLPLVRVEHGRVVTARPGHALLAPLRRLLWHYPNEQFAYLAQRAVEHACVALARDAVRLTGLDRLALAGGVVSNIKATRQMRLLPEVRDLYVFPHMGDGGLALGAAIASAAGDGTAADPGLSSLALGPHVEAAAIERAVRACGLPAERVPDVPGRVAALLERDRVVLWFQGRMEYGPRALGQRSVLARPDRPGLRDRLNLVLKQRVWYQPFCPSLLESEARAFSDYTSATNRHMTMAFMVRPEWRERLAGVINVDGSCRPQLVADDDPGPFAALLREARARWGVGAVLNTSFNIHGEPLVCTAEEALEVLVRSGADALAIGDWLVTPRPA
jgi:carbamoyltransferase